MTNNTYARAYTEILEIIKYFPKEEYAKIPKEKIEFYKKNMDTNYNFTINPEIDLSKQNISKEANAIMVNLFKEYFATEEQKTKINEILELNQKKSEKEKRKKYNPEVIFKNKELQASKEKTVEHVLLIERKETFFTKFKSFILKLLHLDK